MIAGHDLLYWLLHLDEGGSLLWGTASVWASAHYLLVYALAALGFGLWLGGAALWRRGAVATPPLIKHRPRKRKANLADRVAPLLGYSDKHPAPAGMVKIPRHPEQAGAVVEISYPRHFGSSDSQVEKIGTQVQRVLGGEWVEDHRHSSHKLRYVRQAPPAVLPEHAEYVDTTHAVDKVPFAVDVTGPVVADLTDLTPMVLGAASTGWGKSGMARTFLAHMLSHGALADICDPKQISLQEFEGCPNVRYWAEAQDFVPVIKAFLGEIDRRYRAKRAGADLTDRGAYPLRLLVLEEMGRLRAKLDKHWEETKPAGSRSTPEAVGWLTQILWDGRAAGCHVVALAQQANASVMSSSDARDSYALRILAGPTSGNSWRMLFGDEPQLPSSPIKGRAIVGIGPDLREVQLAWIEPARARELALSAAPRAFPESAWGSLDVQRATTDTHAREGSDTDVQLDETAGQSVAPNVQRVQQDVQPNVQLDPVKLTCRCGQVFETTSYKGKCPNCKTWKRVPVGARTGART
jgi:hypothetical protein